MWSLLVADGHIDDAEARKINSEDAVAFLAGRVRDLEDAVGRSMRKPLPRDGMVDTERPDDAVTTARIDALSAVYATWADQQHSVQSFRGQNLIDRSSTAYADFITSGAGYPDYELVPASEVPDWVRARHQAAAENADDGSESGDDHVQRLLTAATPGTEPTTTLAYVADGQLQQVTVDARSDLGELARLADELAERYRWHPAEATMFVLSGDRHPEVFVYTGSAQVRHGDLQAATRVTMTLDPMLTPAQVAAIYGRLRRRLAPAREPRASAPKHYRLAGYVGPRVRHYVDQPGRISRRGRPRQPGPTGLALYIEPVEGDTWTSLRHGWNDFCHEDQLTESWTYNRSPHFIRDAEQAVQRLLWPRWEWKQDHLAR